MDNKLNNNAHTKGRILFVLGCANPFSGAGWARIGFFAKTWAQKGYKIDVLGAFSYKSLQKRGYNQFGQVNLFNLIFNINKFHPIYFLLNALISFIVSGFFLAARRPSITIVSVPPGDIGMGTLLVCKLIKCKYVVDYRDEWEDYTRSLSSLSTSLFGTISEFFYSSIKKFSTILYVNSKCITTVTPNVQMSLKKIGVTKVKLVTNGADTIVFKPFERNTLRRNFGFNEFDFIIVYSGGIGNYYRLDVAIKALAEIDVTIRNKVKLLLVGAGVDVKKILRIANRLGLNSNVVYLGIKNDKTELAKLLSIANVGLIPYDDNPLWRNSLPAKFFEYCACGLPIIATSYGDSILAEQIKNNSIGIISPPLDSVKLADAFTNIYNDDHFRKTAGERARILIEDEFDRNKIALKYLKLVTKT